MNLDLPYSQSLHCTVLHCAVGGTFRGLYAITIAVIAQALLMITEYWVRWWVGNTFYKQADMTNVWILGILTVLCIFIGFYRALSWFEFTLAASSNLHEKSLWAVLHAPLQFFVANPAGSYSCALLQVRYCCCMLLHSDSV
jgi:hypothetical protein